MTITRMIQTNQPQVTGFIAAPAPTMTATMAPITGLATRLVCSGKARFFIGDLSNPPPAR